MCYWVGSNPPPCADVASISLLDDQSAFREQPDRHRVFDAVCFIERNLSEFTQWRVIIDEMVRLLRPKRRTLIFLRLAPLETSLAEFASHLERRRDCSFTLLSRPVGTGQADLFIFECVRTDCAPQLDTLGFGVVSNGQRPDNIRRFIESLFRIDGIEALDWQVAVCGPNILRQQVAPAIPAGAWHKVILVEEPEEWREAGWITRKKNMLIKALQAENVLIVHDRYIVPPDFLDHLNAFGADFDVVVPRQVRNGMRFPDWTATSSEWGTSKTYLLPYGAGSDSVYVNGGALLAKRELLVESGWSELLFWDQSEDVELTRRLGCRGITPRVAPNLWLEAIDARAGYERAFERTRHCGSPMPADRSFSQERLVDLRDRPPREFEDDGLIAWTSQWQEAPEGLAPTQRQAELVLCHVLGKPTHLHLSCLLHGRADGPATIHINGVPVEAQLSHTADGHSSLIVPLRDLPQAAGNQLIVSFEAVKALAVRSIELRDASRRTLYPVHFTSENPLAEVLLLKGWWPLEAWGCWSAGMASTLCLPLADEGGQDDLLLIMSLRTLPILPLAQKSVGITCNGIPITCLSLVCDGETRSYKATIPRAVALWTQPMTLGLSMLTAGRPSDSGDTDDKREIGLGLTMIDLRPLVRRRWLL